MKKINFFILFSFMFIINSNFVHAGISPTSASNFKYSSGFTAGVYWRTQLAGSGNNYRYFLTQEGKNIFCMNGIPDYSSAVNYKYNGEIKGTDVACVINEAIKNGDFNLPNSEGTFYYLDFGGTFTTYGEGKNKYKFYEGGSAKNVINQNRNALSLSNKIQKNIWCVLGTKASDTPSSYCKGSELYGITLKSKCNLEEINGYLVTPFIKKYKSSSSRYPQPMGILGIEVKKAPTVVTPNNKFTLKKVDAETGNPIKAGFYLYVGKDCNGTPVQVLQTNISTGLRTIESKIYMEGHDYSLKEIFTADGYELDNSCINFKYTKDMELVVKNKKTTTVDKPKTCDSELDDIVSRYDSNSINKVQYKKELVELWKKYQNNNELLNFEYPLCESSSCGKSHDSGCLQGSYFGYADFSEDNWSCYEDIIESNGKTGFCNFKFNLYPSLSYKSQESRIRSGVHAGQLYFDVLDGELLNGNFIEDCFFVEDPGQLNTNLSISKYLNSVKLGDVSLLPSKDINKEMDFAKISSTPGAIEYKYENENLKYGYPAVYAEAITGALKNSAGKNYKLMGYGLQSKLNDDESKSVNFEIEYTVPENINGAGNAQKFGGVCEYKTHEKDEDLAVEFRTISKTNPFVNFNGNDRDTKTNWCFGTGYKKLGIDETAVTGDTDDTDDEADGINSNSIKRHDLAKWAIVAFNVDIDLNKKIDSYNVKFDDVDSKTLNWQYILTAANTQIGSGKNIIQGTGKCEDSTGNCYKPYDDTTLAEFVTVIRSMLDYVGADKEEACSNDVDMTGVPKAWYYDNIRWAQATCIYTPRSDVDSVIDPNRFVTESEGVAMLKKATEDCSSDNPVVKNDILGTNDSHNDKNETPMYVINLSQSDMIQIKKDMSDGIDIFGDKVYLKYDGSEALDCTKYQSCESEYLNILAERGVLDRNVVNIPNANTGNIENGFDDDEENTSGGTTPHQDIEETLTVFFEGNGTIKEESCISLNGSVCQVTAPTISIPNGKSFVGWSENQNSSSGIKPGEIINVSSTGMKYYAVFKDVTKYCSFDKKNYTLVQFDELCKKECPINGITYNPTDYSKSCTCTYTGSGESCIEKVSYVDACNKLKNGSINRQSMDTIINNLKQVETQAKNTEYYKNIIRLKSENKSLNDKLNEYQARVDELENIGMCLFSGIGAYKECYDKKLEIPKIKRKIKDNDEEISTNPKKLKGEVCKGILSWKKCDGYNLDQKLSSAFSSNGLTNRSNDFYSCLLN